MDQSARIFFQPPHSLSSSLCYLPYHTPLPGWPPLNNAAALFLPHSSILLSPPSSCLPLPRHPRDQWCATLDHLYATDLPMCGTVQHRCGTVERTCATFNHTCATTVGAFEV